MTGMAREGAMAGAMAGANANGDDVSDSMDLAQTIIALRRGITKEHLGYHFTLKKEQRTTRSPGYSQKVRMKNELLIVWAQI